MKIAIVVHGRFHAFDLARALIRRGHDVTVFTNYPAWAVERFGSPVPVVRTFPLHGALSRACDRVGLGSAAESRLHRMFGQWAARELGREQFDVIHCWSGVSEELLTRGSGGGARTLLMRGSAHIAEQSRLLIEEEARAGVPLDRPSRWMIEREQREYRLADRIVVLSSFARRTFEAAGVPADKLDVLPLGVDVRAFRPSAEALEARQRRVRAGEPLTVLYVGAVSFQKGALDLSAAIATLGARGCRFVLVGAVRPEAARLAEDLKGSATIVGAVPQQELPSFYERADVFVFPTIQDGFGMVLTQAKAAGLPIITTTNCAGEDVIAAGRDGWIIPIRDAPALTARLAWCDEHRGELAAMTSEIYDRYHPRDWMTVADDFEGICRRACSPARDMELASHG